jgi:hypothetical protein
MTFVSAVRSTPPLKKHLKPGLAAIRKSDRARVRCSQPRRLTGSVDLDSALKLVFPKKPRWDYGIGLGSRVVWLEIHPASSHHIDEVLNKLTWLRGWLEAEAPALWRLRAKFIWLACGSVGFRSGSPQMKRISERGLKFRARQFVVDAD